MEDWQGCLSPACQAALQNACTKVTRRGGHAVTLEDFLLAMLDGIPELCRFLRCQGVDLDELTRTIQCEQPIVTEVASENLLASQLVYWLHRAREISGAVWLEWPELLRTLAQSSDRLQEKAYVAVLEQIAHWPGGVTDDAPERHNQNGETAMPPVMADARWLALAEDVSLRLSVAPGALFWLHGERGSGKSSLLRHLVTMLPGGAIEMDIRREADVMASDRAVVPSSRDPAAVAPALVLDNVAPNDLMELITGEFSVTRELITSFPGPVLILGPESPQAFSAVHPLQCLLGRPVETAAMPPASTSQRQAILTAHQPLIEKRWRIELAPGLIDFAAATKSPAVSPPGALLQWVESAAARLSRFAERGPVAAAVLEGQADSLRRQSLLAMARQQPVGHLDARLEAVTAEQAETEADWHERKRKGWLRCLTIEDLNAELGRWLAATAGSGQYKADQQQVQGV